MSVKVIIREQFQYNHWANEKIFSQAAQVSAADFNTPSVVEGRSLQQVLAHLVRTEKIWRLLAQDGDLDPRVLPTEEQLQSVGAIREFDRQEHSRLSRYIEELQDEDFMEMIQIRRWDGVQIMMKRSDTLLHLAMHCMQHRTEAAVLLTQYGYSPGDLDFLFFVLE